MDACATTMLRKCGLHSSVSINMPSRLKLVRWRQLFPTVGTALPSPHMVQIPAGMAAGVQHVNCEPLWQLEVSCILPCAFGGCKMLFPSQFPAINWASLACVKADSILCISLEDEPRNAFRLSCNTSVNSDMPSAACSNNDSLSAGSSHDRRLEMEKIVGSFQKTLTAPIKDCHCRCLSGLGSQR